MQYFWKKDAIEHAKQCDPEESCGIVGKKNNQEKYYTCKNISNEFKAESFVIIGIVHSHPQDILEFSESDKYSCKAIDLIFFLVSPKSDKIAVIKPDEIDA